MNPIFIDLETRSSCDLKTSGGYNYAVHPNTRLLTVAWLADGEDHVWLPGLQSDPPKSFTDLHLPGVRVHVGERVPAALCRVAHRPWVGHNCWTFDRPVWNECTEGFEHVRWIDTYPLALAAGLPGGLDKIGKLLGGEGKYEQGKQELKKAYKATSEHDCEPCNVPIGRLILIAKYNVRDVRLTANLYDVVMRDAVLPESELRVLAAHDAINDRGCRIDRGLALALADLSDAARDHAITKIATLTGGALKDRADVQSRARVLEWLDRQGFKEFKDREEGGKKIKGWGLRKELVARFIDTARSEPPDDRGEELTQIDGGDFGPAAIDDPDETLDAPLDNLQNVVNVLELRMQALRITGGKLDAALWAAQKFGPDHWRVRGLFAYWAAHTGRWGGRRIQVQNLPRPKEGVDTWALMGAYEDHESWPEYTRDIRCFADVLGTLPLDARDENTGKPLYPFLSVDDAAAAMLRFLFLPDEGDVLAAADYAAIEARVLDWCAGGTGLDIFWDQGDPYMLMAEQIFGPRDSWPKFPDPKKKGGFLPLKKHPYRQVGKVVVLGSGYQLGAAKFAVYAAANGIDLSLVDTTPEKCIFTYRSTHPAIAGQYVGQTKKGNRPKFEGGLWYELNQAVMKAITEGVKTFGGRCTFRMSRGNLICTLPSGRRLVYRNARIDNVHPIWCEREEGVPAACYWSPRYGWKYLYGGAIAENIVQAISRDILGAGIVRLEEHGKMPVVLHCHDEAVSTTRPEYHDEFMGRITTCPDWLTDFPLDAEGGLMPRYSKTPSPGTKEQVWRNGRFLKGA